MGKWNDGEPACMFNDGVMCGLGIYKTHGVVPAGCEDCGWNPDVIRKRKENYHERQRDNRAADP